MPPPRCIGVLCVSGRSIYKHLPGVVPFDRAKDAGTFGGGMPVIAHPPCRCWSKYLSHMAKPENPAAEMALGEWCVEQVIRCGGVLEQPAGSRLWQRCGLPLPNKPAHPFLFTIYVEQRWFGYVSRKPTWLLISGVPRRSIPPMPFGLDKPPGANLTSLSSFARSRTIQPFAEWLCQVARLTWWSEPGLASNARLSACPDKPVRPSGPVLSAI